MNVPNEELDTMLDKTRQINKHLLSVIHSVSSGNTQNAVNEAWAAQKQNNLLRMRLENAGAVDKDKSRTAALREELDSYGYPELEGEDRRPHAIELLSSPAAERYAAALRECANACRVMEIERGHSPSDGMTEWHELQADAAELEVFGPKELR